MIARTGTWGEVVPGSYVQDTEGTAWRVDRFDPKPGSNGGMYSLFSAAGVARGVGAYFAEPVTILEPTEAEAVELVSRRLGGTVIADA